MRFNSNYLKRTITLAATVALLAAACFAAYQFTRHTAQAAPAIQGEGSPDGLWQTVSAAEIANQPALRAAQAGRQNSLRAYRTMRLNRARLGELLSQAPMEFSPAASTEPVAVTLPLPNGTFARFRVEESPIMEPELAAKFPKLKTYRGWGIDDPTATVRFNWTPTGLHALLLSAENVIQLAPAAKDDVEHYLSFFRQDVGVPANPPRCGVTSASQSEAPERESLVGASPKISVRSDSKLRTYRLAVAATRTFTNTYGGGTVDGTMEAISIVMNLVNTVYEREISVRMRLVNNNDRVIYTNNNIGPYKDREGNNASVETLKQNDSNLDAVIGSGNYDVGHLLGVYSEGAAAGRADLSAVCGDTKGQGCSLFSGVLPGSEDGFIFPFDIEVVTHELGHQFGANHTFNHSCGGNRNAGTAVEPDSGSTIMSYGYSNCSKDTPGLQQEVDPYFHFVSLLEMGFHIGGAGKCATPVETGNNSPIVRAGTDFTIPSRTPFTLEATGSDPDGDKPTYVWEQVNTGAVAPPNTDDGSRPIFRSFKPITSPARTFPSLNYILENGNEPPERSSGYISGEALPTTNRTLAFQITARDSRGGFSSDSLGVRVIKDSGPFVITKPNTLVAWPIGSTQTVTWDVANTDDSPINCRNVKISLSTDGGFSFMTLIERTPNDGSETLTVPNTLSYQARIKVEAIDNIFFDISNTDFEIVGADLALEQTAVPDPVVTGMPNTLTYTIQVTNQGPADATSVVLTDELPATTSFVSCQSTNGGICDGAGNNRRITFDLLPAGTTATATLVVFADCSLADGTTILNTARVESLAVSDPDLSNNSVMATTKASNPPPIINNAGVDRGILSPPDGRMHRVKVAYDVTDNCPATVSSLSVGRNPAYPLSTVILPVPRDDVQIIDNHTVLLRAVADDDCPRYYVITITSRDSGGAISTRKVFVKVPLP